VIVEPLVHDGISGMLNAVDTFETRMKMNPNLKVALSAMALIALVAAPAAAKSRTQTYNSQAPAYSNNAVVFDGQRLGSDPDAFIRGEIRRDYNHYNAD
jgi:hypothetical protein